MRETRVEDRLTKGVEALGGTCEKFVTPGKKGPPDRIITWPIDSRGHLPLALEMGIGPVAIPLIEYVETKAPRGVLESWQARDHARRREQGFIVTLVWNFEEVDAYLKSRGKR